MTATDRISRRTALGTALAATAAPMFVPATALGRDGAVAPSERVSLAIVGMGVRGNQLAMNVSGVGRITAICDADTRKMDEAIKQYAAEPGLLTDQPDAESWVTEKDYRRLFERDDIDGVMITACDHHHVLPGILACQAGKDIYVEKPLSLYLREGRALVDAARRYDRIAQTGTQQRTMEMDQFACEFVRDGGIGKVRVVECVNFHGPIEYVPGSLPAQPVPAGVDWDLWQGQAPQRPFHLDLFSHWMDDHPGNWWGNWAAYSNRQITGLGAHAFDMVQYALGMDDSGPVELWPVESGRNARVHFRYKNGVEVRLRYPDKEPYRGPRLGAVFTGSDGKIEINRNKFKTNPVDLIANPPDPALAEKWEGDGWVAKGHVDHWLDCIRTRKRPNADVEIGHRTASVCHLIEVTRKLGRRVRWDPERELFPGDDEANALLDRPRRAGWELPQDAKG